MPTHAEFWDRAAEKYAKSPIKNMSAYEKTLDRTRHYLNESDTALELGCGTGSTALLLAGNVGHLTSTDVSGKMIEIAERKLAETDIRNLAFQRADIQDVMAETPFDTVLAFNLLHLVIELDDALAHIAKIIQPGGYFISKSVCLADGAWYFRPLIGAMRAVGYAPPVNIFTIKTLEEKITAAGFEIVETGDYPAKPPSRFVVARRRD